MEVGMLRSTLIVALMVVAGPVGAFAEQAASSASTAGANVTAGDMRTYKLAPGDRITVMVFGQPELSGDFLIDGMGNIHLPLMGTVSVGQATVTACEERLTERLAQGFLNNPRVSVRVTEFRPVHVLGDVRTPGAYPFRFGLSALGAIALAGGAGVSDIRPSTALAELLAVEERVNILEATHQSLLVRMARMDAERTGRTSFDVPQVGYVARGGDTAMRPAASGASGEIAALLREEQEQLAAGTIVHERTIGLLKRQKPRMQREIEATKEQIASEIHQVRLSQDRLKVYTDLAKKGFGKPFVETELRRDVAQAEGRISRLNAELARLDVGMGDLDIRIQEAENARGLRMTAELRETKLRLHEIEASLPAAREALELRRKQAGLVSESDTLARSYRITLIRGQGAPMAIDGGRPIEPGDILEVRRIRPDTDRSTTTACAQGSGVVCTDARAASLPRQPN
jgi:polysaccharide export outer membrane protein